MNANLKQINREIEVKSELDREVDDILDEWEDIDEDLSSDSGDTPQAFIVISIVMIIILLLVGGLLVGFATGIIPNDLTNAAQTSSAQKDVYTFDNNVDDVMQNYYGIYLCHYEDTPRNQWYECEPVVK